MSGNILDKFKRPASYTEAVRPAAPAAPPAPPAPVVDEQAAQPSAVVVPLHPGKIPYRAFELQKPEQGKRKLTGGRFRVLHKKTPEGNRPVELLSFSYLVRVLASSHKEITMIFTHAIISLEGEHLGAILDALEDDALDCLTCFDPERHAMPGDGEPLIINIRDGAK